MCPPEGLEDTPFTFIYFCKYETIETHSRAFLPLNISAVGSVTTISIHFSLWNIPHEIIVHSVETFQHRALALSFYKIDSDVES